MTLEEAKKILEKEFAVISLHKSTEPFEFDESRWIEHEKPSVLEAFRVLSNGGYYISISGHDYNMREKRLKKEYEKNTKAPGPGEEQPKEGNPALEESASQFNDALLDEQAKKIKRLGKEITRLNKIIHKKNEELRLTKIREKNLTDVCQKYMKEAEELKDELANKVVDKIDAQALKSAESALAYKENVITDLTKKLKSINMNRHNERIYKKQLAEKDEVISDLGKELAEAKKLNTAKILDFNAKCMRAARESINDVFESYAAKYAKSSLDDLKEKAYNSFNAKAHNLGLVGSKDGNGIIDQMVGTDFAEEGADLSVIFVLCGKDFIDALKNVKDVWQE